MTKPPRTPLTRALRLPRPPRRRAGYGFTVKEYQAAMRWKRSRTVWAAVGAVCFLLSLPQDGLACSCAGPGGRKALEGAAAAFSGKVTRVEYLDADRRGVEPRIKVTFKVYRSWKGPLKKSVVLHTVYNKWTCEGYHFEEGREYLVFAYRNRGRMAEKFPSAKGTLGVNVCGATGPLADAEEELRELGPGRRP